MHAQFLVRAACALALAALIVACGGAPSGANATPTPARSASADNPAPSIDFAALKGGKDIFMNLCAKCHGLGGLGDGPSAGSLRTQAGLNLTIVKNQSDDELYRTISAGKGADMAPFELILTKEQRLELVKFVRSLEK